MNEKTPNKESRFLRLAVCLLAILALLSAFTYMLLEIVRDNNRTRRLLMEAFLAIEKDTDDASVPETTVPETTTAPGANEAPLYRESVILDLSEDALTIVNNTSYSIDAAALLSASLPKHFFDTRPMILIYHSDPLASYWQSDSTRVSATHPFRDREHNVTAIGNAIRDLLSSAGIASLHLCETVTDIESTLKDYREKFPSIRYCLDVRRDGIYTTDGRIVKSDCQVGSQNAAQLMLAVGTDRKSGALSWQNNLAAAYQLADMMKQAEPTSIRPVYLCAESLSQADDIVYLTVFVGTTGNTLDEAVRGGRFFARYLSLFILSHCGIDT